MALPSTGTISYNNVAFGSHVRSKITVEPILDDSGRVVKWNRVVITIEGWLSGDDMDDSFDNIKRRLTRPAQELKFEEKGFGDLHVNGTSRVRDAKWGPIPKMISWTPLGGDRSCLFTWQVETLIPYCEGSLTRYEGLIVINYEINWNIDDEGYTSRTITGHLEIAQTRQRGSNRVKETADEYRDKIKPALLEGFQRSQDFRLSMNRNRLDFVFVDKQLPMPLPGGATKCEFDHTVSSGITEGFYIWRCRLSGTITLPPGDPKYDAYELFLFILASRMARAKNPPPRLFNLGKKPGFFDFNKLDYWVYIGKFVVNAQIPNPTVIIDRITIGDQVFGRQSRFDVEWRIMGVPLALILYSSGLFTPISGTSHALWKKSMADVYDVRGLAGLKHIANQEALIDLCVSPTTTPPAPTTPPTQGFQVHAPQAAKLVNRKALAENPKADADSSWLRYQNDLRVVEKNRTVIHKKLPNTDPDRYEQGTGFDPFAPFKQVKDLLNKDVGSTAPAPPGEEDVVQTTGSPRYLIEMRGFAMRVGHSVPVPRLLKIGGKDVKQIDRDVDERKVGGGGSQPVYAARWTILYAVDGKPTTNMPDLVNPAYQEDGKA
jgi:hypothetical protein